MKKYDLLIKNAYVFPLKKVRDIAIKGEYIVELKEGLSADDAAQTIDAKNKLVTPGFVEAQLHIDKAYLYDEDEADDVMAACIRSWKVIEEKYSGWSDDDIIEEIVERGSVAIENCIRHGTVAIKNNITVNKNWGVISLKAISKLKEKYKDKITIKNVVQYDESLEKEWINGVKSHEIDFVGGYVNIDFDSDNALLSYVSANYEYIDKLFALSREHDVSIDVFCDEISHSSMDMFLYIVKKVMKNKEWAKVTCNSVTSLGNPSLSEDDAAMAIAICAKAGVNITTLTSTNMNLGDIKRRSTTRVKQLQQAGVNVSIASGNVRDAFRPFGNCDLLEEALLTAQCHKYDTQSDMSKVMAMITFNPAKNLMLQDYGILPSCYADLVIFDATDEQDAIISQAEKDYVIYHGKVVAKQGYLV